MYLWREAAPPWKWHGPYPIIAVEPDDRRFAFSGAAGNLALISSHQGADQQNWELVSPAAHGGGVLHFWRDNVQYFPDWRLAPRFLETLGTVNAVTMIESELLKGEFALEVVARIGPRLWFVSRDSSLRWASPFPLTVDGRAVIGASGTPSLIQSRYGVQKRNFELITPRAEGGLMHLWRDNDSDDPAGWRWRHAGAPLDPGRSYQSASLLQGTFGADPGNLELVARTDDGQIVHFWRDAVDLQWRQAVYRAVIFVTAPGRARLRRQ